MAKDLTSGSPMRLIMSFALPLLAGNFFEHMHSLVDTFLVGRFLGVEALAAVGCTGGLMFLLFGFLFGSATGLSILAGQRFGAKDHDGVHRSAVASLVSGLVISIFIMIITLPYLRYFLILMQTPPSLLDNATTFISIICASAPLIMTFGVLDNLIRALGDSKTATILLAFGLIVNIILEPIFLLVFSWGVPGAALGVTVSHVIMLCFAIYYIKNHVPQLWPRKEDWHLPRKEYVRHLRLGVPMGFQSCVIALGAIILQIPLNNLGEEAVAAYAAAQKVDTLGVMPMISFGMAMAAYTSQNYGARQLNRIREGVKVGLLTSGSFAIVVGTLMHFFGSHIIAEFVGEEAPLVIEYGHQYLSISGACYFFLSVLFIFRFTLQGLGKTFVPVMGGIVELSMRATAAFFLAKSFGYLGVCLANPLAWTAGAIIMTISYWVTRKELHDRM